MNLDQCIAGWLHEKQGRSDSSKTYTAYKENLINDVQSSEAKLVGKIGRITPVGQLREFPLLAPNSELGGITTGPDGALWFTEDSSINGQSGKIGRLA